MRIQVQGFVDAAFQRLLQDEVQRAQMIDRVAADLAFQQAAEALLQGLLGTV